MVAKAQSGRGFARGITAKLAFLPDPVRLFMKRRAFELAGGVLIAAAAALALALASYNSLDVSLNNASGQAPANLLGPAGATIADLALQSFGIVAVLPVLALLAWGARLVRHSGVARFGWRVLGLLLAVCALAFALHAAPAIPGWPIRAGLGGTFGDLAFPPAAAWLGGFGIPAVAIAITGGAVALLLLFPALGLSRAEWRRLGAGTARGLGSGLRGARIGAGWSARHGAGAARRGADGVKSFIAERGTARQEPRLVPGAAPTPASDEGADDAGSDEGTSPKGTTRGAPRAPKPTPGQRAEAARQRKLDHPPPGG